MNEPYRPRPVSPSEVDFGAADTEVTPRIMESMRTARIWILIAGYAAFISALAQLLVLFEVAGSQRGSQTAGGIIGIIVRVFFGIWLVGCGAKLREMQYTRSTVELKAALNLHRKYWTLFAIIVGIGAGSVLLMIVFGAMEH